MSAPSTATRADDVAYLNATGQDYRLYVAFGNEVKVYTDGRLVTPPVTYYPQDYGKSPDRPTAVMGPNRIGFVGDILWFYGGRSYKRNRGAAVGHTWQVFKDGVEVSGNSAYVSSFVTMTDTIQTYRGGPQPAICHIKFAQGGIYEVALTVYQDGDAGALPHTTRRQVVVVESRETASTGVVEVGGLSGSMQQGGWSCALRVRGDLSFLMSADVLEGYIPVIIGVDTAWRVKEDGVSTWVNANVGPDWHTGAALEDPFILFNGYIDNETISIDYDHSEATFQCRTCEMILENMQTHVVGFFEHKNDGLGVTFNDLTVGDVYSYMLKEKSNFADYHDVRLYYNSGYVPTGERWTTSYAGQSAGGGTYVLDSDQVPNMEYRDWTFNQGAYWTNIRDGADNQFELAFCDRTGAVCVWPDRNMWYPQVYYDFNQIESTYIGFGASSAFDLTPVGPGDTPIGTVAKIKNPLDENNPWDTSGWTGAPVSVPERITVRARLAGQPSYYKIVASLSFWNEEWGADYPKNATDPEQGQWLLSGNWVLVQGKYWSDQDKDKAWRNLWRFAARGYQAMRSRYTIEVTYGLHLYWRLGDMVEVVYSDPQGRFAIARPLLSPSDTSAGAQRRSK